jgi:uncharacterized protein Yka (UPF0111/DUF47 family)
MTTKETIIKELGEEELILPVLVNNALAANDRIKYFFTLLQTAQSRAKNPQREFPSLREERDTSGIDNPDFDRVVPDSSEISPGLYRIPHSEEIFSEIKKCMNEMSLPVVSGGRGDDEAFKNRLMSLLGNIPRHEGEIVKDSTIQVITSGNPEEGDSLHLLVMDLHRALNRLQGQLSSEVIDGAMTYLLDDDDRNLVKAFMKGLDRTKPLKFDHPGLGTTATRSGPKLVIQNDIGMTDAHVMVINVVGMTVSVVYTDIHMPRLQFFISLFDTWKVRWEDTLSRRAGDEFEKNVYHLAVGKYTASGRNDLEAFLDHLGSRLVFLIDWNRARKRLRNFLLNKDSIALLKWAADKEYGHMAFLLLGGERIIYDALELAAKVPIRYGEPLHQILGTDKTIEYFQWVFRSAATGMLANQSRLLIQDEIKTELLRYFRSANEGLMEICEDHATLIIEVATVVRDSLISIQRGEDGDFVVRSARRAKKWETEADAHVNSVRSLSRRIEAAGFFAELINIADDALDFLEEASFFTTLIPGMASSKGINSELVAMADISVKGSQEFLKALIASQYIHKGYSRDEMQDFLRAVDRVVGLERECDEALRRSQKVILVESTDYKELQVYFELTRTIEESTNSLMKAAYRLRDTIIEEMNR